MTIEDLIEKVPNKIAFIEDVLEFETNMIRGHDYKNDDDLNNIIDDYARDVASKQLTGHIRWYHEVYPDG